MVYYWSWDFLAECAANLILLEKKLTEEQLVYLRQYYGMNKSPGINELRTLGKELNNLTFGFFLDLETWFCYHRMGEQAIAQRRYEAKKVAA